MPQFSIHINQNPMSKKNYPYLINVQSTLLDDLETRLVIPLTPISTYSGKPIKELNPIVEIKGKELIVLTQQMAAIRKSDLGSFVCDIASCRQKVLSSIDFLITGF